MAITAKQQRELANLARKANRRLERASEGQRAALEHYIKGYTTREGTHGLSFSQAKANSEAEYRKRMKELGDFLGTKEKPTISLKSEWNRVKNLSIKHAKSTLDEKGFNITEKELSAVLQETRPTKDNFYHVLELMQVAKNSGADITDDETIIEMLTSRLTDYQITLATIKARNV